MSEFKENFQEEKELHTYILKRGESSGPLKFSEPAVEIVMADKSYQIIRVDPRKFKTSYLLIDPQTFDPESAEGGFGRLRDGREVFFGRHHPHHNISYTPNVSRTHLSIKVKGDDIIVTDHSTQGTKVIIEGRKRIAEDEKTPPFSFSPTHERRAEAAIKFEPSSIFELAGERTAAETLRLIRSVEQILTQEAEEGLGKLGRNIEETQKGRHGNECFVDGKIVYLPPKGRVVFVGDTHADSISTEAIIEQTNFIKAMEQGKDLYLAFLGDYSGRGTNDARNLELLLALKERYPENVILMAGDHERCEGFNMSSFAWSYGLQPSLQRHYGEVRDDVFGAYLPLFRKLPCVLVAANGIVAVHAGIPEVDVSDLRGLRNQEELFLQMAYNDPNADVSEFAPSHRYKEAKKTKEVSITYEFGQKPFDRFMHRVGGKVMVRSHQFSPEGYELFFGDRLVTIFSTGGTSEESYWMGRVVKPRFMVAALDEPISRIEPEKHIVGVEVLTLPCAERR